jgi:hypothetical protein
MHDALFNRAKWRHVDSAGHPAHRLRDFMACPKQGILCKLGMCVIVANIMEQCSLFLPLQRGAGPMALMLWLDWVT